MGKLISNLLILHSKALEDRLVAEAKAAGLSKSATARQAIGQGFATVMEMSRGQILTLTHNDIKMTDLPRVGAHLARQTDKLIRAFASDLNIPIWRIYSLSIDVGLDAIPFFPPPQN
jgi:hypothetical protein